MDKARIVTVSFQTAGKVFDFNACEMDLSIGDKIIVETERGRALASVITAPREEIPDSSHPKLKNVLRIANATDLEMAEKNAAREAEALYFCKKRVHERKLEMKLVRAEYLFDGSKIVFFFTADGRIDFRELVRDLAQHFRTRIEMRQIGVRDEAKMVGGLGVCGRELCCCTFMRSFAPVSVKMAKAQGLALNPSKISGQCGRLLCCLGYEYDTYNELRKNLPKVGKKITLASGQVDVIGVNVLKQSVTVSESGQRREVTLCELEGGQAPPSSQQKPEDKKTVKKEKKVDRKEETTQDDQKPSPSRRRNRRRSSSKAGEDHKERGTQQQDRRSDERRTEEIKPKPEKQQAAAPQNTSGDQKEGTPTRPRRRRRRPRNRQKPTPQNEGDKS